MITKTAYTLREVAVEWGFGWTTLNRLIKAGDLKPVKIGARAKIRHADLKAMIERWVADWREGQGLERD